MESQNRTEQGLVHLNMERLITNMTDQILEAQIKLGYAKETIRLYYPVASLNAILGWNAENAEDMLELLHNWQQENTSYLGMLQFGIHGGRIEVSIPPEGVTYVHENIAQSAFLKDIIELFQMNHHCTIEDICNVFERYSPDYVCEKMPEDTDFDYCLHFQDGHMDEYYYCVKMEMGHTIYHRFMKEDYEAL
jgi:hypothetical protein